MSGRLAALYRHPVKGFTPERVGSAVLETGGAFPCDRLYAVENGPSGFDPGEPKHLSKTRFTVLAQIPQLARVRTRYDEATGVFTAEAPGRAPMRADLDRYDQRAAFAAWLTRVIGEEARGPLRVVSAPGHRFWDDARGHVSMINLASVRDLAERVGAEIDPLRFRANLYVDGLPPWSELAAGTGRIGGASFEVVKPILRCVATHVDPRTGERDLELVKALFDSYGHAFCGVYLQVAAGGTVAEGDDVNLEPRASEAQA
jgi:uncharacterized protein YcbX